MRTIVESVLECGDGRGFRKEIQTLINNYVRDHRIITEAYFYLQPTQEAIPFYEKLGMHLTGSGMIRHMISENVLEDPLRL